MRILIEYFFPFIFLKITVAPRNHTFHYGGVYMYNFHLQELGPGNSAVSFSCIKTLQNSAEKANPLFTGDFAKRVSAAFIWETESKENLANINGLFSAGL